MFFDCHEANHGLCLSLHIFMHNTESPILARNNMLAGRLAYSGVIKWPHHEIPSMLPS